MGGGLGLGLGVMIRGVGLGFGVGRLRVKRASSRNLCKEFTGPEKSRVQAFGSLQPKTMTLYGGCSQGA